MESKIKISFLFPSYVMRIALLLCFFFVSNHIFAYDDNVLINGIYYRLNGYDASVTYKDENYNSYSGDIIIPLSVTFEGKTYQVTEIGEYAFSFSGNLTSVSIPSTVTKISNCAFQECSSLSYISIPNSVEEIGDHAFDYAGLTDVSIGNAVKIIGGNAFTGCQFTTLTLPEGLLTIEDNAFSECSMMNAINLPGTLTSIGDNAFDMCSSLTSVTIPESVTHIGIEAFEECHNLISMVVESGNIVYDSRDNCNAIVETSTSTLISGCKTSLIPNTITAIGDYAFYLCSGIDSISIPSSVKSIGNNAFCGSSNLSTISIGENVDTIGENAFLDCDGIISVTCLASIPPSMANLDCFSNVVYGSAVLKVPTASLESYIVTDFWNKFLNIEGITNGVEENTNIYIVGSSPFGDWSPNNGVKLKHIGDGIYTLRASIDGTIWFVFADGLVEDDDWETFNSEYRLGPIGEKDQTVTVGEFITTQKQGNGSGAYQLPAKSSGSTEYKFTFDLNNMRFIVEDNFDRWDKLQDGVYWDGSTLYICSFVTSLGDLGVNPTAIYSFASVPPTCTENTFTDYGAYLTMPDASYGAYFTAEYWCNFAYMYNNAVETTGITLSNSEANLTVGESVNLTAYVSPNNASYQGTQWRSTNKQVATVNYEGQITAQAVGECDIVATCVNYSAVCHVVVENTEIVITLDKHEERLKPNHSVTITPTISPMLTALKITISDPSVAAARLLNGVVQVVGLAEGTTSIVVGSEDGLAIPDTCVLTVYTEVGDVNCDGFVNIGDITQLIDYLLSGNPESIKVDNADINRDEHVNIGDVTSLIDYLLSGNWPWDVPAQGWPTNYDGVMLQGFYWDSFDETRWAKLESQADELAEFFKLVWIPQSANTGGGNSMGYDALYWFTNYNSSFGFESQLRSMINTFMNKGIGTIADVVINHRKNASKWVEFPAETYKGVTYQLKSTDICRNDDGGEALKWATANGYELSNNNDTGEDWVGLRDLDHLSENVQYNVKAYLEMLLNDLGYAGFRYDMCKGYASSITGKYNSSVGTDFSVGEYWDSNISAIKNWIDGTKMDGKPQSAAFDFPLRYTIRDAANNNNWSNLASGNGGLALLPNYRRYAVTFVENHETQYRDANNQNDPIRNNVEAANAYMLAMPGTPCIFLKHWIEYKESIKQMIYARQLVGITNTSSSENTVTSQDANYYVQLTHGEHGDLLAAMGSTSYEIPSAYIVVSFGTNYRLALSKTTETAWTNKPSGEYDSEINVTLTAISQNEDALLVYTLDGTDPTANSTHVADGTIITISESTTLKVGLLINGVVRGVITRKYIIDTKPFEPYEITIFLKDPTVAPNNWPVVNFFSWDSENNLFNGHWPGQAITNYTMVNGEKFYYHSYTITDKNYYMNFVFNTGYNAGQTVDIPYISKTSFYEVTSQTNKYEVTDITDEYLPYINN